MPIMPCSVWSYSFKNLMVYEGASAFYLVYIPTGREACIGDGVNLSDAPVGSRQFYADLKVMIRAGYMDLIDAYDLDISDMDASSGYWFDESDQRSDADPGL